MSQPYQLWEIFLFITPLRIYIVALILILIVYVLFRLQTKRFYIVRHGRTVANDAGIKQGTEGGLNDAGKQQAHKLGKALTEVRPRISWICSSPFERTKETATIVDSYLHVPVSYTPLLAERRNPDEVIGKSVDDTEVKHIVDLIEKGFHQDEYRFSGEENFQDLKKRVRRCLRYLQELPASSICVVTHHAFLQMLLSYIHSGRNLNAKTYATLAFFNPSENAAVTICVFRPWKSLLGRNAWEILTYNQGVE